MSFDQSGSCQCGNIRYRLKKPPKVIYCCHCTECQKQSSSAYGISVRVENAALEVSGTVKSWKRPSASGGMQCDFCPDCGTRLFHRRLSYAAMLNIKGGTFDDTSWIEPAGHIWTSSKQAWVSIPENVIQYDEQPENYDILIGTYSRTE